MDVHKIATSLREYLSAKYPVRNNVAVSGVRSVADGWETEVFTFTISYEEDGKAISRDEILRVYAGDSASAKASKEFAVMRKLFETGYPVPEVYLAETNAALFGAAFVVMQRINGPQLGRDIYPSQSDNWQGQLARFCEILVDLHGLDPALFGLISDDYAGKDSGAAVSGQLAEAKRMIGEFGFPGFAPILDWLDERVSEIEWGPVSVIHYDYHPWNILVDGAGDMYVIDWTCAEASDYRVDLAWTLLLVSGYGQPEMRGIVLAEYERVAGAPAKQIEYFEVMACVRRLFSIVVTLSAGAGKLGMREGAAEMMKSNTEHIEYVYLKLKDLTGVKITEVERFIRF